MNHKGAGHRCSGCCLGVPSCWECRDSRGRMRPALQKMTARFAPVDIGADISALPAGERRALAKLVHAGRVMDALFLRQVWGGNEAVLLGLLADASPIGQARLHEFLINKGPWASLDGNAPFVPGVPAKPGGANFYPAGATKAEVEAWLQGLRRTSARGPRVLHRDSPRRRRPSPSRAVQRRVPGELARAADLLREAAASPPSRRWRASSGRARTRFLSNDYYGSDVAWMELDAAVEPTIGPYEVYEDEWFNYKAAFEAFITVRDAAESAKLARFSAELQDIEDHLPIPAEFRNPALGGMAPIRVVNVVLAAGDGTAASRRRRSTCRRRAGHR